jgi:hypothetical protein
MILLVTVLEGTAAWLSWLKSEVRNLQQFAGNPPHALPCF